MPLPLRNLFGQGIQAILQTLNGTYLILASEIWKFHIAVHNCKSHALPPCKG
jgi:hypothetical protein